MQKVWETLLPALLNRPVNIKDCWVSYARCRTFLSPSSWAKSYLSVCYQFKLTEEKDNSQNVMIYAKAYQNGESYAHYQNRLTLVCGDAQLCKTQWLPELDMIFWFFPDDPELPQLSGLLDPDVVRQYLPYAHLPFKKQQDILDIKIDVIRYRPEQRCILRYIISYGNARQQFVLYAKIFEDDKAARVFAFMQQCANVLAQQGYDLPQPMAYSPETYTVWQTELSGQPLIDTETVATNEPIIMEIGRILASFHTMNAAMPKTLTREAKLIEFDKKIEKLTQAFPAFSAELNRLSLRAHSEIITLPEFKQTVIHGDMHFGQFLVKPDDTLVLLDFDGCCYGDPAQDLADFIVDPHLYLSEREGNSANLVLSTKIAGIFLASYRQHAECAVDDTTINWHARIQLINQAYRAAITQTPNWQEKIPALITLAMNKRFWE